MTAATDNAIHLTPEYVGVIQQAVERRLLGLGIQDGEDLEERLGITSKPDPVEIDRFARSLKVCGDVLADAEFARLEPTDDVRALLVDCETEAVEAVEDNERAGVHAEDLDIARARLVMLRTFRKLVEQDRESGVMVEGEDLTAAERQMAEHELGSVSALLVKMLPRLDLDLERPPSDEQVHAVLTQLVAEDPEARDLIETLGTFHAGRRED